LLRRSVLTPKYRSQSDLGRGTTDMVIPIMGITILIVPITIGRTPTITMGALHSTGTEAIDITATIVTITTTGIKVM